MIPLGAGQMAVDIGRRRFIFALSGAAVAWPSVARAQQPAMPRIAVFVGLPQDDPEGRRWIKSFLDELSSLGWKPDANLRIDWRWSGDPARMQDLAKEIVRQTPDLIVTTTTPVTAAVLRETQAIPVVFAVVSDPVGSGFVQSLPHPGGNATGFINIETSIGGKWLGILKEIAPDTTRVTAMFNPKTAPQSQFYLKAIEDSAPTLGLTPTAAEVAGVQDIEATINDIAKLPNGALVITPDTFTVSQAQRDLIIALAARLRVPTIYFITSFVKAGGLVSYGVDNADLLRGSATYVDRILKGEKPSNLPVQLPTKFELAINTKTAKALGLTVPQSLLATADEVIE
jgi:putative tryptophan/tyrosine transport system substrate-binding protein